MDYIDREIINRYQGGIPISDRPYGEMAKALDISESEVMTRIRFMLDDGLLTRCGPMYNIDKMGGIFSLCAIQVPEDRYEEVAEKVNAFLEVAHNYQRDHRLNMWFVLAAESEPALLDIIDRIEKAIGLKVFNFPKQREFYVQLQFEV